jgi:siroheme synthase (precorrin-2 oxidase/ferrochelatase)
MTEQNELMTRKLRRRIEEFLRNTTPEMLIRVANLCRIKVPQKLKEKFKATDEN